MNEKRGIFQVMNEWRRVVRNYIAGILKWMILAVITGAACGVVGTGFHIAVEYASEWRVEHTWLLYLLPVAGVAITAIYHFLRVDGQNTNNIIDVVLKGRDLRLALIPAVFAGTVLTHLCGGSAGREGAALQMGGDIGIHVGKMLRFSDDDRRTATLCGMAALFSALFGTPLAATIFAMTVSNIGLILHSAYLPCLMASLVAYGISLLFGVAPTHFNITVPALGLGMVGKVAVLGILCALVSVIFCEILEFVERNIHKVLPNKWVRAFVGGAALLGLTLLIGYQRYNGAGMNIITNAVENGSASAADWMLKIVFTVVTLACGFKGGEVVPSFFIGATFGCWIGPLLGIPAGFAAALGLIGVFCGATNCMIATILLSVELFGSNGLVYFSMVCGLSYLLSGYSGFYTSQTILTNKLESSFYIKSRHTPTENKD